MPIRSLPGKVLLVLAAAAAAGHLTAGCSPAQSGSAGGKVVSSSKADLAAAEQREIERIRNDPRMPPQARAAALEARKRAAQSGQVTRGGRP